MVTSVVFLALHPGGMYEKEVDEALEAQAVDAVAGPKRMWRTGARKFAYVLRPARKFGTGARKRGCWRWRRSSW